MTDIAALRCPICQRPAAPAFRPFCSQRCADVDLGRWFSDSYAVPVADDEDMAAEPEPRPGRGLAGHDGDA